MTQHTDPIYAIGDIHGQSEMLDHALELIDKDNAAGAPVVFLGDYVDRGSDSKGVLERLSCGLKEGRNWICLLGNHDQFMLNYFDNSEDADPYARFDWLDPRIGGRMTLSSYGIDASPLRRSADIFAEARETVPVHHLSFLSGLRPCFETDTLFFAHAGIRPDIPFDEQSLDDLIWIRNEFLDDPRDHGKIVVHGHTPVDSPCHYGNRVNLDSGAGFDRELSAAVFDNGKAYTLNDAGRCPLEPVGY